jgi:hypothetical protein
MSKSHSYDRELHLRGIIGFVLGLTVLVVVAATLMYFLGGGLKSHLVAQDPAPSPLPEASEPQIPPEPRLLAKPVQALADLRAEEGLVLSSYGWVDKEAGTVHVPIEDAMRRVVEDGMPTWEPAEEAQQP